MRVTQASVQSKIRVAQISLFCSSWDGSVVVLTGISSILMSVRLCIYDGIGSRKAVTARLTCLIEGGGPRRDTGD